MRSRLYRIVIVTITEGPGVYVWLRLHEAGHPWWGLLALVIGEFLETALVAVLLRREAPWPDPDGLGPDRAHIKKVAQLIGGASIAEIGIWIAWVELAALWGQIWAGVAMLALMHVKHHVELIAVRDTSFKTGFFGLRGVFASAMEVAGAVACLALLLDGRPVWAAVALAVGFLVEHTLLVDVLQWELEVRDISRPRDPRWRPPTRTGPGLYLASRMPRLWRFVDRVGPLQRLANRVAINGLVAQVQPRPNPFSTLAPYTSWKSLTDKSWSGRHLPPVPAGAKRPVTTNDGPPTVDTVMQLFARQGEMTPCPKSTVLFPCFAQWFTDGILRTTRTLRDDGTRDTRRNEANHDIDLAQLYGLDDAANAQLRAHNGGLLKSQMIGDEEYPKYYTWSDGTPKADFDKLPQPLDFAKVPAELKPKLFAMGSDTRNLGFVAFNVLFLREHNRIARLLAEEHRDDPDWDDERLFATARNILTVVLLKIVVEDYINHINPSHLPFRLKPGQFPNEPWHRPNWLAIEFNLLYRWHSLVPSTFELKDRELTIMETLSNTEPLTTGGLGAFMEAVSEQPAGRLSLFNTDQVLVMGAERASIQQARFAALASYNDYRRMSCMPPMRDFAQISSDPRVQQGLAMAYETVEDVEFYVGLFAEESGPDEVLPPLVLTMVAFDAFSQALTSPLLAPRVFNEQTFTATGMQIINDTGRISDLVNRNVRIGSGPFFVSLTRRDYVHS